MKNDCMIAKEMLDTGKYTCVLCKENNIYTSTERGVKPLIEMIESSIDYSGYSAADKVVGKAAAFLYVLLNVKEIYAYVISEKAIEVLTKYKIKVSYNLCVKAIRNRNNTGNCPMEETVSCIDDPHEALTAVQNKILMLS